jgi:hypothetical protein
MFFQPEVVTSCTSSFPLTSTTFHKDKELEWSKGLAGYC